MSQNFDEKGSQMSQKSVQTSHLQQEPEIEELRKVYDYQTSYIKYPLGPYEDSDVQCYTFNIFNQFLKQNLSFCEIDEPLFHYKEKYFAKLQPEVNPILVDKIIDNILKPIRNHIYKFTEKDSNLDSLYDETMVLIKKLNSIKIQ